MPNKSLMQFSHIHNWFLSIEDNRLGRFLLLVTLLAILFGGSIADHIKNAMNPFIFNDDVRQQIVPFYGFHDSNYKESYTDKYYLNAMLPYGFTQLYKCWSMVLDPTILSKSIPYIQLFAFLLFLYLLVYRWAGYYAAVGVLLLSLSTDYFFYRGVGGLPRSFAFPLLSATLYYLALKKWDHCATLVLLGGCFYPMTGVVLYCLLSSNILHITFTNRRHITLKTLYKNMGLLSLLGLLFLALCLPNMLASREYGGRIAMKDLQEFPEAGIGGRYVQGDFLQKNGIKCFILDVYKGMNDVVYHSASPRELHLSERISINLRTICFFVLGIQFFCFFILKKMPKEVRHQTGIFFFSITLLYFLAVLFEPYLYFSSRYIQYTLPLFFLIMIVVSLNTFFYTIGKKRRSPLTLFVLLPLVIFSPGKINGNTGYSVDASLHANLYRFISVLPPNSVILGWPNSIVDNIPYLTKKKFIMDLKTIMFSTRLTR